MEVKTTVDVVTTKTTYARACDRCGKPAPARTWDFGLRIPVRKVDRYSGEIVIDEHSVDACNNCLEMVWRMFNCQGITKKQMEAKKR